MTRVTDTKLFLDSNIWLGYILGNIPDIKELIESKENALFTSIISIHEVFKIMRKTKGEQDAIKAKDLIEENSLIIGINQVVAVNAVNNCNIHSLHTIDSLIYSTAENIKSIFITSDKDFHKTPNTKIIEIKK